MRGPPAAATRMRVCLLVIAFVLVGAAVAVGVVVLVQRGGDADDAALTR